MPEAELRNPGLTGVAKRADIAGGGNASRRFLSSDERGSIVSVTDGTGVVLALNSYDEYGIPAAGNIGAFGYTGQTWIPELGLWHYKARIYSPTLGRFMQTDPIGYEDSQNLYAYVLNDPINWIDPLGLEVEDVDVTACRYGGLPPNCEPIAGGGAPRAGQPLGRYPREIVPPVRCPRESDNPNTPSLVPPAAPAATRGTVFDIFGSAITRTLGIVGLALSLSGDTRQNPGITLRHYTNDEGYSGIIARGLILQSRDGFVYLTPDLYYSGGQAQQMLALRNTPTGFFSVNSNEVVAVGPPTTVPPSQVYGQPGGGKEVRIPAPVPVGTDDWTPICP